MERKPGAEIEEFEPAITWAKAADHDTLVVYLPGFRKEHLKVQVTSEGQLRIIGERPLGNNKWSKFQKLISIPNNYDPNEISAKFENNTLYIKHPKIIAPAHESEPKPQEPASDSQAQTRGQEQPTQRVPSKTGSGAVSGDNGYRTPAEELKQPSQEDSPPKTAPMEKQKSGPASANNGSQRFTYEQEEPSLEAASKTSKEKTPSRKASEVGNDDNQKAPEREKEPSVTMKENENLGAASEEAKMDKGAAATSNGGDKSRELVEDLKRALGVVVMELKHKRKLMNLVVVVLFLLVAVLYARNAVRSMSKSNIN